MNEALVLVLDAGTLGARASLISFSGRFLATEVGQWSYDQDNEHTLWRSFDPQKEAAILGRLAARCLTHEPKLSQRVRAIAVTGQRFGCVALDSQGQTIYAGPQFDARGADVLEDLNALLNRQQVRQRTGRFPSELCGAARLLWLKRHDKASFDRLASFGSIPGFFASCFTGTPSIPELPSTAADTLLLNIDTARWDVQFCQRLGLKVSQLGTISDPGHPCGKLADELSSSLGLAPGLPVILAGNSTSCAGLAAGARKPGDVAVVLGATGSVLRLLDHKELGDDSRLWLLPYSIPGTVALEAGCGEVGFLLNWFRQEFGGQRSLDELFEEAMASPVGGAGVVANMGPRCARIDEHNPGSVCQWTLPRGLPSGRYVSRAEMFRSLIENIVFAVKQGLAAVESTIFPEQTPLVRLSGSLGRADLFGDVLANVLDRPVAVPDRSQATSLGAAMMAAVAIHHYSDFEQASLNMAAPPKIFEPVKDKTEIYQHAFETWLSLSNKAQSKQS